MKSNLGSGRAQEKGGAAGTVRPTQDLTMLNVAERPIAGKVENVPPRSFHTISELHRAQLWLDQKIANAGDKVTAELVTVTPELAEVLLSRNEGNRKIKQRRVDDFSRDIETANWKVNGEPLIVSRDGRLNDGQHRCAAVIQSKLPTDMLIVFGVAGETRDTVDHGVGRSPGDDLALHGLTNTVQLAAAARMVWRWREFGEIFHSGSGSRSPTRMEILHTVESLPGISKALSNVGAKGKKAKAIASISLLAFCHFAFRTVANDIDVTYFFDALTEGENLQRGDPILNARNRLIAERSVLSTGQKAELLFRAWNAYRAGETARVAFRLSGGELPELVA